ncbi:MAG: hypothetical protein HYU66_03410 [Armatimonadetes bacterium]|nr:hypothetical protein [Armatimonadota bacterium]
MADLTNDQIAEIIQTTANDYRGEDPSLPELSVSPESVRYEDGWYYVDVVARQRPARAYPFYDQLRELESRLRDRHQVDVLLAPARAA